MPKKSSKKRIISFSRRVYDAVRKIPRGKVLTYKQVADLAGNSWAFRAVGNILNKNYNKSIPCHRVIRSDGQIGGFRSGTDEKISLLNNEGVIIKRGKIVT
jgi:methylated-DNA-[protein]-cysteine S-methyltransferase